MAETTVIRLTNVSGTSYVIDVSGLQLAPVLTTRDFTVTHNSIDVTSSYTKTSATQLSYAGTAVVLGTVVNIVRTTPLTFNETTFVATTTANELTNVLSKLKRRVDELEAIVNFQTQSIALGGLTLAPSSVSNVPFDNTWSGDVSSSASRNALFNVLNTKANLASPTFTGTATAPTPTPNNSSNQIATTAFVKSLVKVFARKTTPQNVAPVTATTVTWDAELLDVDNAFNPATGVYTVPANQGGIYLVGLQIFVGVRTSTTAPSSIAAQGTVTVNGAVRERLNYGQGFSGFYQPSAFVPVQVNAGETIATQAIVDVMGGSGITLAISPTNVSPELSSTLVILKLT